MLLFSRQEHILWRKFNNHAAAELYDKNKFMNLYEEKECVQEQEQRGEEKELVRKMKDVEICCNL